MKQTKTLKVDYLARVEGEGGMTVKMSGDKVTEVRLNIFEPPRFFEAFLKGRSYKEVPDITSRICGICPIAYQSSSIQAMEQILGIEVNEQVRTLRRLMYCGEWIESHALHMFMLHAPDFLGYQDAIELAKDHPDEVKLGLFLKKTGNDLVNLVGGREIHPINMRVGGFYKLPTKAELNSLLDNLKKARDGSIKAIEFLATLEMPSLERDYEFVALRHESEYPIDSGRIISNKGIDIDISQFESHFTESHVEHSTSLHSKVIERGNYHVGPLARFNLNFDRLPLSIQSLAKSVGLEPECKNPFKSILIRGIELLYSFEESIRIIEQYERPDEAYVVHEPKAGVGYGCTEAPRGICWHRYEITDDGSVATARIVPPTSQNQGTIEDDLRQFVSENINMPEDDLTWRCEQAIRNYDPCISCSCHYLKLKFEQV